MDETKYYALSAHETLERLQVDDKLGLSADQVRSRVKTFGENQIQKLSPTSAWKLYLRQYKNLLVLVLFLSGLVAGLIGERTDSIVIMLVIIAITLVGFVQEGKAQKAIESISSMLSHKSLVMRDGVKRLIDARELVPGDIVFLKAGDKINADVRLVKTRELLVDESVLSGESLPVEKSSSPVDAKAGMADRTSMSYAGTFALRGSAHGVVVATGQQTEIGRIGRLVQTAQEVKTPLLKQMDRFSAQLSFAILFAAAALFLFAYFYRDMGMLNSLMASVSLIVAAIPEGLAPIMTITLAIGVQAMAKRRAIVRKLPAVETLGSVNIICSDKTGTLTQNRMSVKEIRMSDSLYEVGEAQVDNVDEQVLELIRAGALCNEADFKFKNNEWSFEGDPTDTALLALALKTDLDMREQLSLFPRKDTIPFQSENKFMATLHASHTGEKLIYVKGAPEKILHKCSMQLSSHSSNALDSKFWLQQVENAAEKGLRTICFAQKKFSSKDFGADDLNYEDIKEGLTLIGMVAMLDPPRERVKEAIADCHRAGICVKMVTGDHAHTAKSIADLIGLDTQAGVLEGQTIDELSQEEFDQKALRVNVFARTSPEQKMRLVKSLQKQHNIVAMTGDGVNDAPGLKQANVGVAMGRRGTQAARDVSEIVLSDDNFSSIVDAVKEGRTVYDNLMKSIYFLLPTNGAQALTIFLAVSAGWVLPLLPLQILWVNLVTAITLAMALAFERSETNVMDRPPRTQKAIFSSHLFWRVLLVSGILVVFTFGHFYWIYLVQKEALAVARSAAVNTLVFGQVFYLFNCRTLLTRSLSRDIFQSSKAMFLSILALVVLQLLFTYLPVSQSIFEVASLSTISWLVILGLGAATFLLVEFEKWVIRFFQKKARAKVKKQRRWLLTRRSLGHEN